MEMVLIDDINMNVEIGGNGSNNILLLHGWGQSTKSFTGIDKYLHNYFKVYNIDLPGFGLSDKPPYPFNTEDYAHVIKKIIDYYEIHNPIIIGHSFGGRVAIKYAFLYKDVKKLILIDSAGIVHKKKLSYYIKVYTYKLVKKILSLPFLKKYRHKILSKFGSNDYKNADNFMKKVLINVVNEDLRDEMKDINCPTLLFWGTNDDVTPLSDAYIMKEYFPDAGLVKIPQAGHFSYLDNMPFFLKVLDEFLKNDK